MTFEIDTDELDVAIAGLRTLPALVDDVAEPLLDEAAVAALDAVRSRASRHRVSGRMVRQVALEREGDGVDHRVTVRAGGSIAPIVIGGSVAHDIRPVRARALTLQGSIQLAAHVRHPGTRPDPFVERGLDDATAVIDRDVDVAADRLADRLADRIDRR